MLAPSQMIGGGEERTISIIYKRKKVKAKARIGLYGTWLGIVTDGPCKGYTVVPRWQDVSKLVASSSDIPRIEWTTKKITYPVSPSLYYAFRQTFHMLHRYGKSIEYGERKLMTRALNAARELNYAALGLRKGNVSEYEQTFNAIVDQIEEQIGTRFYNPYKKEALQYFERLRSGKNRLGRVSETVKMVEAKAAERRIQKRIEEIGYILPVIAERKEALEVLRDMIELRFLEAKSLLADLLGEYRFKTFTQDETGRKRIASRLLAVAQEMSSIDIQPYTFTCLMCAQEFIKACNLLLAGKIEAARQLLEVSLRSLQLKDIQRQIEERIMQIILFQGGLKIDFKPLTMAANIDELCGKLQAISEAGFRIKTKSQVMNWLESASAFLQDRTDKKFEHARLCLRNASDAMQVMGPSTSSRYAGLRSGQSSEK